MGLITPWKGTQFSGFMDDELGKLANITPEFMAALKASPDPFVELQKALNPTSIDQLSNYLLNSALFSDPLLSVDGWFLLTPNWWDALFDRDKYPLISMLEEGLISSFSRYDGVLHDLPDREADKGIVTYQNIINDRRFPKLKKRLETLDNRSVHSYVPWPKYDMDLAIDSLLQGDSKAGIRGVFEHSPAELGIDDCLTTDQWTELKERFRANRSGVGLSKPDSSRQAWIRAIIVSLNDFGLTTYAVRELATIGIKAYHQSRALVLDIAYSNQEIKGSSVPTEFLQQAEHAGAIIDDSDFFDGILSLSVSAEDIAAAGKMDVIKELGRTGSTLHSLKEDFLLARDLWLHNPVGSNYNNYKECSIRYMDSLNPKLSVPISVSGDKRLLQRLEKLPKAKIVHAGLGGLITFGTGAMAPASFGAAAPLVTNAVNFGERIVSAVVGEYIGELPFLHGKLRVAVSSANFDERARRRQAILNVYRQGPHTISPVRANSTFSNQFKFVLKEY